MILIVAQGKLWKLPRCCDVIDPMTWQQQMGDTGRTSGPAKTVTVQPPAVHEGLGDALRKTYAPRAADLPADMRSLLDRLR